ncbi:ABC transporter ATP-binding protein [Ornithinimicrobium sp. LYQ92]|uniref:ABC transporter ATP-binding protein n=1 Tax=Serinicoccus sp. LYQ92 TaxID=3378798 RepID=UPI003853685C
MSGLRVQRLGVALPVPTPATPTGRRRWLPTGPPSVAGGDHQVVLEQVDLEVRRGEVVVLLGPSGAGKSTLLGALLGLLPQGAQVRGYAWWDDEGAASGPVDLLDPGRRERARLRGRVAAWLPQSPVSALTPVLSVRHHLQEKARVHVPSGQVRASVDAALRRHDVEPGWLRRLPSQLSGGQAQRVSNALALLGDPGLVLADEPTTGLDRDRARAAGAELSVLAHEENRAVLVVTHDLELAEQVADRVVELDDGRARDHEDLSSRDVLARVRAASHEHAPHHLDPHRSTPQGLAPQRATPQRATPTSSPDASPGARRGGSQDAGLAGVGLTLRRGRGRLVRSDVDIRVRPDTTTGLMAPSGAGKTTLLRTLALLHAPSAGQVRLEGRVVRGTGHQVPAELRRRIAYVPQDPRQAVDPRWRLGRTVAEPLRLAGRSVDDASVPRLLELVGLDPELADRRPDEVSGGQLQRVVLARAIAMDADYLLLDEPTSMVDSGTSRAVVAAVHEHQHRTGCGVLVASHDEELLRTWCDVVLRW